MTWRKKTLIPKFCKKVQEKINNVLIKSYLKMWLKKVQGLKLKKEEKDYIALSEVTFYHTKDTVRADIFVVNGLIHIYEIKSVKDNITRLEKQLYNYSKVANRITLVIDKSLYDKKKQNVDEICTKYDAEVQTVDNGIFNLIRKQNKDKVIQQLMQSYYFLQTFRM